jgi:hypothetical protein
MQRSSLLLARCHTAGPRLVRVQSQKGLQHNVQGGWGCVQGLEHSQGHATACCTCHCNDTATALLTSMQPNEPGMQCKGLQVLIHPCPTSRHSKLHAA